MKISDRTDFNIFLAEYASKRNRDVNKIILRRSREPYNKPFYVYENPKLKMNEKSEFLPEMKMVLFAEDHFYVTLARYRNYNRGLYYKISHYFVPKYGPQNLVLYTTVVTMIKPFEESITCQEDCHKLDIKNYIDDIDPTGPFYGLIPNNKQVPKSKISRKYYSDIPWSERINMFRRYMIPGAFLTIPITMSPDAVELYDYSDQPFERPNDDDIVDFQYRVTKEDRDKFHILWYRETIDGVFRDFTDLTLVEFLQHTEIPILSAIMREASYDEVTFNQLEFVNNMSQAFRMLDNPNALDLFLFGLSMSLDILFTDYKKAKRCQFCLKLFKYRPNKKYCSFLSEGRDCGKKARNKKDYARHRDKRRTYYRNEMKSTRKFFRRIYSTKDK